MIAPFALFLAPAFASSEPSAPPTAQPAPGPSRVVRASAARTAPAQASPAQGSEEPLETHSFAIPDTRAARGLEESAQAHIQARRWNEALSTLQELIEDHRADVLPGTRPSRADGNRSQEPVHRGAARHARDRMWTLPPEAREIYARVHDAESRQALERARAAGDVQALCEVARRWPLTEAARRAWRAAGDLELERGHEAEALAAWVRALGCTLAEPGIEVHTLEDLDRERQRLADATDTAHRALAARLEFARGFFDENSSSRGERRFEASQSIRLPGPGEGDGPPPGAQCDAWASRPRLPDHPFKRSESLFPARSGDLIFVSTSLRLLALQAYSGALVWDSLEAPGWSSVDAGERADFFKGVDAEGAMIAPAASPHVVLAALQIPVAFIDNDEFQRIPITTRIPDRRLFAFDVETGRKLWDHMPPPLWDGESGGFIERMSVAGPPVIAGSRVLAPFCRMQGRIDYHVGCFDLETGALLWSTNLISGQRELNMFGRAEHEFCAPPLRVAGDRVLALTQLGAVAALDLFTGEILWETLYEQIALPKNKDYRAPQRMQTWRNAPPVVSGDVVIAAPFDSRDLIGLDVDTGALLWSLDHHSIAVLADRNADIDLVIGAGPNVVYLAGSKVLALESSVGLRRQAPTTRKWVYTDDGMRDARPGRAVVCADRIVVPTLAQRVELDLEHGQVLSSMPWDDGGQGGNLLVGAGELHAVSGSHVEGYFEWDVLMDSARAELVQHPADAARALALGQLLARRGTAEWQRGETAKARTLLAEAKTVLERARGLEHADAARAVSRELHGVLRCQARVLADLADSQGALRALRDARASAVDSKELCATLFEEHALLLSCDPTERKPDDRERSAVVDELERSCAELSVACDVVPVDPAETSGAMPLAWIPIVGPDPKSDAVPSEMPVGLWVLFERARMHIKSAAWALAFADLHQVLERYAKVELGDSTAGARARESIGALLRAGQTAGYAEFEARAAALYTQAEAARDRELLARIPELYPYSRTAEQANDTLLEWATAAKDAGSVARILLSELPADWQLERATPRELMQCLRLVTVMEDIGNEELSSALLRTLAERHPDHASDLAQHGGARLRDLARDGAQWQAPLLLAAPSTFDQNIKTKKQARGDHTILGRIRRAPDAAGDTRLCLVRVRPDRKACTFFALDSAEPLAPAWEFELATDNLPSGITQSAWARRVAFSAGRVVIAAPDAVIGVDSETGTRVWQWHSTGMRPEAMTVSVAAGVAIVVQRLPGERSVVQALDAHGGTELWREGMPGGPTALAPILASNRVVFLPSPGRKQVLVRDLFTGRRSAQFELDVSANNSIDQDAWIEGDRLIVPWFNESRSPERNQIASFELADGRVAWRIAFETEGADKRTLSGVLQHERDTYLIVRPYPGADRPQASSQLYELNTAIGALTPLPNVRLSSDDRVVGMSSKSARLRLANPRIFLLSSRSASGKGDARLRAVDPRTGELWSQLVGAASEDILATAMPEPAMSDTTVVIAYTLWPKRQAQSKQTTSLAFFDASTGVPRGARMLSEVLGKSDEVALSALGNALVVRGRDQLEVLQ